MKTKIITERLSLDILTINDHAFIRELVNTEGWLKFIGDRKIYSDEDAIAYINKINSTPTFTYWIVRLKETSEPIGIITFLKRNDLAHHDIGFAFLPEYNSKGYAYEATREVLAEVSKESQHRTILAITIPGNLRSVNLLTKLGFKFEREIEAANNKVYIYSRNNESITIINSKD